MLARCNEKSKYLYQSDELKIKNQFDTRFRMFYGELREEIKKFDSELLKNTQMAGSLLGVNMLVETAFYLPNRFRQSLMVNTAKISFESSEKALLGLMSEMFNLGQTTGVAARDGFTVFNFLQCYRHFFRSTLLYESFSLTSRTLAYEILKGPSPSQSDWLLSFGIGAGVQGLLFSGLWHKNITNHINGTLLLNRKEFNKENSKFRQFVEKNPLVWLRGGILGMLSLTLNEKILIWMEANREEITKRRKSVDLLDRQEDFSRDTKINDFIYSVHDKSHVLYKLAHLGYFDVERKSSS